MCIRDRLWLDHRNYEPLNRGHITRLIRDRSLMAGVYVTAHAFRRGFAVLWFRHGGPAPYIKALAGWNSDSTIEVYVRSVANEEALRLHAQYFG